MKLCWMSKSKENTTSLLETPGVNCRTSRLRTTSEKKDPTKRLLVNLTTRTASPQDSPYRQPRVPIIYHLCTSSPLFTSTRATFRRSTIIAVAIHQSSPDLSPMLPGLSVMPNKLWHRLLPLAFACLLWLQRKSLVSHSWRARQKDCRRPLQPSLSSHRRSISMRHAARRFREFDLCSWCN